MGTIADAFGPSVAYMFEYKPAGDEEKIVARPLKLYAEKTEGRIEMGLFNRKPKYPISDSSNIDVEILAVKKYIELVGTTVLKGNPDQETKEHIALALDLNENVIQPNRIPDPEKRLRLAAIVAIKECQGVLKYGCVSESAKGLVSVAYQSLMQHYGHCDIPTDLSDL